MTIWTFNVKDHFCVNGKSKIDLTRGYIELTVFDHSGRTSQTVFIDDKNELPLLFFAQQLISILSERDSGYVLKNHVVVTKQAESKYREVCKVDGDIVKEA